MNTGFQIRPLQVADLPAAMSLVWRVFEEFEAPDYSAKGIDTFRDYIRVDAMSARMRAEGLRLSGCSAAGALAGVLAVSPKGHVHLLFVDRAWHRRGIATTLIEAEAARCREAGVEAMTVNSSPYALQAYRRMGFVDTAPETLADGLRFIPMRRALCEGETGAPRPAIVTELPRDDATLEELLAVWQASVAATHHFLAPGDAQALRPEVRAALLGIRHLFGWREDGRLLGFGGVQDGMLEMLFLHPEARGRGCGRALLAHAVERLGVTRLDVNEENTGAVGFYQHMGFAVAGRSQTDGQGRPYPLLHMALASQAGRGQGRAKAWNSRA